MKVTVLEDVENIIPIVRFGRKKVLTGLSLSYTTCDCEILPILDELDEIFYEV